jgi:hypothetical protein
MQALTVAKLATSKENEISDRSQTTSLLPLGTFIRTKLTANVPINKNAAKTVHAPGCTGFGLDLSLARLARYEPFKISRLILMNKLYQRVNVPRKLQADAIKPPSVPSITA